MSGIFSAMRRLACVAALVMRPLRGDSRRTPPLSAFGNLPDIESMALSNDGSRLAAVMTIGGERVVVLMTAELDTLRMLRIEEAKVRGLEWIGTITWWSKSAAPKCLGPSSPLRRSNSSMRLSFRPPDEEQQMVFDDATMLNAVFGSNGVRNVGGGGRSISAASSASAERAGITSAARRRTCSDRRRDQRAPPRWRTRARRATDTAGFSGQTAAGGDDGDRAPLGRLVAQRPRRAGHRQRDLRKRRCRLVSLGKDGTTAIYSELNERDHLTRWFEVPLDGSGQPTEFVRAEEVDRRFNDRRPGHLLGLLRDRRNQRPQFFNPQHQAAVEQDLPRFRCFRST
jgi:hypothetical protein